MFDEEVQFVFCYCLVSFSAVAQDSPSQDDLDQKIQSCFGPGPETFFKTYMAAKTNPLISLAAIFYPVDNTVIKNAYDLIINAIHPEKVPMEESQKDSESPKTEMDIRRDEINQLVSLFKKSDLNGQRIDWFANAVVTFVELYFKTDGAPQVNQNDFDQLMARVRIEARLSPFHENDWNMVLNRNHEVATKR